MEGNKFSEEGSSEEKKPYKGKSDEKHQAKKTGGSVPDNKENPSRKNGGLKQNLKNSALNHAAKMPGAIGTAARTARGVQDLKNGLNQGRNALNNIKGMVQPKENEKEKKDSPTSKSEKEAKAEKSNNEGAAPITSVVKNPFKRKKNKESKDEGKAKDLEANVEGLMTLKTKIIIVVVLGSFLLIFLLFLVNIITAMAVNVKDLVTISAEDGEIIDNDFDYQMTDAEREFFRRVIEVRDKLEQEGISVDTALVVATFNCLMDNGAKIDYEDMTIDKITTIARNMADDNLLAVLEEFLPSKASQEEADLLIKEIEEKIEYYKELLELEEAIINGNGSGGARLVQVALSQLSKDNPSLVNGEKYWRFMGFSSQVHWCACFVSWCANEAGVDKSVILHSPAVDSFYNFFTKANLFHTIDSGYIPQPGDLIIWERGKNANGWSHVGIVEKVDPDTGQVYTIEGNSSNKVSHNVYKSISKTGCTGFASPNYPQDEETEDAPSLSGGKTINIPQDKKHIWTVTEYDKFYPRWTKGTKQRKIANKWMDQGGKFKKGFAVLDGRYLVAVSEYLGKVGQKIDVYLNDGTVLPCMVADAKSKNDSNYSKYGHLYGNNISVIEWEVKSASYKKYGNPGTNNWWPELKGKKVTKIVKGG